MSFVVSLIARPGTLPPAAIEALRNAWGGGTVLWLSPDEAAEFAVSVVPDNADQVWRDMQDMGIDVVILPERNRRKKVLLADMDSTMIEQECIDELADEAGVGRQVAEITARAMNGELDFEGSIDRRVGLLRGLDEGVIQKVLSDRITFMPGARTLVRTMKANGGYAALVSGGFTAFTAAVAGTLGFDQHAANTLEIVDGRLTGRVLRPILGPEAKFESLLRISQRLAIDPEDVIAVGDGMNDLLMLSNAGMGVALHGKPALQAECDIRINHGDLTALLYLQGYARHDFVDA